MKILGKVTAKEIKIIVKHGIPIISMICDEINSNATIVTMLISNKRINRIFIWKLLFKYFKQI